MAQNACPACDAPIATADINIEQGVALCRGCGKLSQLADVVAQAEAADPELAANPPPGCRWYQDGATTVLVASARSVGGSLFALAFATFWNGVVSVFVLLAAAGLYTNLVGPLPSWFPVPPMKGQGSSTAMPLSMAIFLCIFLIPFVLIGMGALLVALHCLAGRVEVRLLGDEGVVRNAVGPLSWKRRFHAGEVKRVTLGETTHTENGRTKPLIKLEADRTVKFGSMLSERRRDWLMAALHALLLAGPVSERRGPAAALSRH